MPESLLKQRRADAQLTAGTSGDPIYNMILACIESHDFHGSVLDFGAGCGNLTSKLAALGRFSQVSAADIMDRPPAVPQSIRWIQADLNESITALPDASLDTVVISEVIEHLENPRSIFREAYRLLRPGGALVLTTPNNESWRSLVCLLFRGHFAGFWGAAYPAHKTALLRLDLQRAALEAGLNVVSFSYSDSGGIPSLPRITWQQISFGLLRGLRFSDNLLIAASKPLST